MLVQRPSSLVLGAMQAEGRRRLVKGTWQLAELPRIASKGLPAVKGRTSEPERISITADKITLNVYKFKSVMLKRENPETISK